MTDEFVPLWNSMTREQIQLIKIALGGVGAALGFWSWALARAERSAAHRRLRDALLIGTAVLSGLAWWNFLQLHGAKTIHTWEIYHHYIGAKYFAELGYDGMYDCTVLADYRARFPMPPENRLVRNLSTNHVERASRVLTRRAACLERFSNARFLEFERDLDWFRSRLDTKRWAKATADHGLNATPVWALIARAFTASGPLTSEKIRALVLLDPLLLLGMWGFVFWGFGWQGACFALIFWGTNYPGEFGWVGGAFLRQDWLAAAVIGLALLRRGYMGSSGFALTLATLLRILPGFLVAGVVLHWLVGCWKLRRLALDTPTRRFALGCVVALATLGPLSVALTGASAWPTFVENSRTHLSTPGVNFVGWQTVVSYEHSTRVEQARDPTFPDPYTPWHQARRSVFAERAPLFWLGVGCFAALLAWAAARNEAWVMAILGAGTVVMATHVSSYYLTLLFVYGLFGAERPALAGWLCVIGVMSQAVTLASGSRSDMTFAAISLLCVLFVTVCTLALARQPVSAREAQLSVRSSSATS